MRRAYTAIWQDETSVAKNQREPPGFLTFLDIDTLLHNNVKFRNSVGEKYSGHVILSASEGSHRDTPNRVDVSLSMTADEVFGTGQISEDCEKGCLNALEQSLHSHAA